MIKNSGKRDCTSASSSAKAPNSAKNKEKNLQNSTPTMLSEGDKHRASEKNFFPSSPERFEDDSEDNALDVDFPELLDESSNKPIDGELMNDFPFPNDDGKIIEVASSLPVISSEHLPSLSVRDNLQNYLREISKFPMLKPEEEVSLARSVRDTGDPQAAFRLISSHLRLVVRIAMDFQRRWMQNVLDLIQEGNIGLLRAVNKFDPDKGIKFSYYASFWIKAYILKFIMDNWRMVKLGTTQAQRKLFYNLNKERQKLMLQGFEPDSSLLAETLGVTPGQVVEMQQRLDSSDVSLNTPVNSSNNGESDGASRIDFLPALGPSMEQRLANTEIGNIIHNAIQELVPKLSEKEVYILKHRLVTDEPDTLREIGERYHVTRERIRQLEARLLEKLKAHLQQKIKDFSKDWISP